MDKNDESLVWKEECKRTLLKTVVFTVTERTNVAPDGSKGKYIVNEAKDWVIVVPCVKDKFLMVKQWRHGEKSLSIEFPGGVIDEGEVPEVAASRELKEETGCVASKMTFLGSMNPNPALFENHVHIFCAENLVFTGKQNLDDDEYVHYMEIDMDEVRKNIGHGEYCHALMGTALALYENYYE